MTELFMGGSIDMPVQWDRPNRSCSGSDASGHPKAFPSTNRPAYRRRKRPQSRPSYGAMVSKQDWQTGRFVETRVI